MFGFVDAADIAVDPQLSDICLISVLVDDDDDDDEKFDSDNDDDDNSLVADLSVSIFGYCFYVISHFKE